MSTIINARSPYFIKFKNATNTLTNVTVELKVWSGLKTAVPTTIDYTISKKPLVEEVGNYVVFEISELIRDYLKTEFFNEAIDAVWVEAKSYKTFANSGSPVVSTDIYLALDGYGYFEERSNPRRTTDVNAVSHTPMVLQSNHCIQFIRGRDIKIPVFSEFEPQVETDIPLGVWNFVDDYWENSDPTWDATSTDLDIVDSDDSKDKIQYVIITTANALNGDTITFTSTQGTQTQTVITVEEVCEPKFEPVRSAFYNKFGALQTMWFPLKHTITTRAKSESFNSNTIDYGGTSPIPTYSIWEHNKKKFNIIATQGISVNTTLLKDCYNEPIEQMLMSESIWIARLIDGIYKTRPVFLTTSNIVRKTGINDKAMIQYKLDFEFAYEKINNVR